MNNRLRRRLKETGVEDFSTYLKLIEDDKDQSEVVSLLNEITTNETRFFRTEKHFTWLKSEFLEEVISQARKGNRERKLRIWSAAASSGEEPYSIAMCLHENRFRLSNWDIEIIGSDLNRNVLEVARRGIYGQRAVSSLDEKQKKKYFSQLPDESKWQLKSSIQEMVKFESHNLIRPWKGPAFDCVFLRNVLIYFDRESKKEVVRQLTAAIRRNGYLVVGPSEGIFDLLPGFTKHSTFLYQKQ